MKSNRFIIGIAIAMIVVIVAACLAVGITLADRWGMFSEAKAARAVAFFEQLKHTDGQFYGQPFTLLPWERQIIRDVYGTLKEDGTRQYKYVYIEIPKKNGKSALVSGAALYHLFADGEKNGEVYGCAADKKQAGIVFKTAKRMIEMSPTLLKRSRIADSIKTIEDRASGTIYEVLSAEAFTKHGFKVSACLFDELHAQPNRDLWDVMTWEAGSSRKQPIWWIITTAGDDPDRLSIGWEEHEYALKVLEARQKGDFENDDPSWYVVMFNYLGEDIYNEANWYRANPSLGVAKSIDSMREAAAAAKKKPANERLFRWLDLNQWITTKLTTWLPLDLFDATVGGWNRADLMGKDCYLGMDLSSTTDLSAICALFPPQGKQPDWRCFWQAWIPADNMQERIRTDHVPYDIWTMNKWVTPTAGDVVDYTEIEKAILEMKKFYNVLEVPSDRAFAAMLLQRLEQAGLTCVDIPQNFRTLTGPMNVVEMLLRITAGKIKINADSAKKAEGLSEEAEEIEKLAKQAAMITGNSMQLLTAGLTHEDNGLARWAFGNASIAKNGNEEIKLVKEHKGKSVVRTKRIDPIAALVDAMARAQFYKGSVDISANILADDWGM